MRPRASSTRFRVPGVFFRSCLAHDFPSSGDPRSSGILAPVSRFLLQHLNITLWCAPSSFSSDLSWTHLLEKVLPPPYNWERFRRQDVGPTLFFRKYHTVGKYFTTFEIRRQRVPNSSKWITIDSTLLAPTETTPSVRQFYRLLSGHACQIAGFCWSLCPLSRWQ